MPLGPGTRLGAYEILTLIGRGGMGEVYRARDTRLDRSVAIKVVSSERRDEPRWRDRFRREARAISGLNHPHICTLHDVGHENGVDFLVMEYLEGETLADRLRRGALPLEEALRIATQLIDALGEAYRHGLVHRDIKPGNVFLTTRGDAKILDFGLAKITAQPEVGATAVSTITAARTLTHGGELIGTVSYMSPEQLRGAAVDHRTDLFSFGLVLYEMVTGERAFSGSSAMGVAEAIMHAEPRDLGDAPSRGPLKSLLRKLLAKDPANRYGTAQEVESDLKALEASLASARRPPVSRTAWIVATAAIILSVGAAAWLGHRYSRERWARETATPEIARLLDVDEYVQAATMARAARAVLSNDPTLERLWMQATGPVSIVSVPVDAEVSYRPYRGDPNAWERLGWTPIADVRVPKNHYIWRIAKPGFAPTVFIDGPPMQWSMKLTPQGDALPGMVPVIGQQTSLGWPFGLATQFRLADYLIDQHEVTNEEYQQFVDAGGYQKREFWTEPFVRDGRTISWEEAIASFRDTTGRPGPATWHVGSFPKGLESHPVVGVSWYEAAAYAKFVGKSLPTIYHWTLAAQTRYAQLIVPGSNFSGRGTVPVGAARASSGFGTTDMAGNVKEWCLNESSGGKRFILGGGFGEESYMFNMVDALSLWERRPNHGFRCVKLTSPPSPAAAAKLEYALRDVWKDKIVSDEVFGAFKGLYAYDHADLHARVEETQGTEQWTREKVGINAAYGNERLVAHLYLPKHAVPPFQTVVYFPGAGALLSDRFSTTPASEGYVDFLLKSGRAVMFPLYKGTYERRDGLKPGGPGGNPPAAWRDHVIMWSKDLSRSVDYLETRKDVDATRIAYFGFSLGGGVAPVLLAMETRFKAAVLSSGGLWFQRARPEADGTNFVTRVKIPVLMLNGRYDSLFPVDSAQLPIFRRLGTPDNDKRHVIYDGGHGTLPHGEEARETLDWFDKYLGPVRR